MKCMSDGKLKEEVIKLRAMQDKEECDEIKKNFPAIAVNGLSI
jgi:hypothetical protein